MIEEIIGTVGRYAGEKVRISKGMLFFITVLSFAVGLVSGAAAAKVVLGKRITAGCSCNDEFDADEYVRNLNFDEE